MVLSVLNSTSSRRNMENMPPQKVLGSPMKSRKDLRRSRAHNVPGGLKHLLSDPRRRRRASTGHGLPVTLPTPPSSPARIARFHVEAARVACFRRASIPFPTPASPSSSQGSQAQATPPITLTFPRRLPDLVRKEISPEVLASLGFATDVPAQYIRDQMEHLSPSMYQTLRATRATATGCKLPTTLAISVEDDAPTVPPTHMVAVYSSAPSAPEPRRVTLYPIHQSILSTYCANLPVLATSTPQARGSGVPFEVPVVPLALPHPESFPMLSQFLYLKDAQVLLEHFLCASPSAGLPEDLDQPEVYHGFVDEYSGILARNYTAQRLAGQALAVHGFWRNAAALGISDGDLQAFFDMAWEVLMKSLLLSKTCPTPPVIVDSA
ncbi:hypothetical protein BC834DRAFT_842550 [Gloeopeniophorella convolvens]|nr:hypothetical protein BC834DRAFT_842550 [Gloeopeniophorella convolvens]